MIERKIVAHKLKEFQIRQFISDEFMNAGICNVKLKKTPLGDKVVISTSRPGLIVGRKGKNIKQLTITLKNKFNLENPELEIDEIKDIYGNSTVVGNTIAISLEKYGIQRFKGVVHTAMQHVLESGAKGVEVLISGKVPSSRARSWRFYQGYLKKSGDVAQTQVDVAYSRAELKTGTVGIKVSIMQKDVILPDSVEFKFDIRPKYELADDIVAKEVSEKIDSIEPTTEENSKLSALPEEEVIANDENVVADKEE